MRTSRFILALFIFLPAAAFAQPKALAELFRNIDCGNCQTPDNEYDTYVSSHPGVVLINYHSSAPDNKDPFYLKSLPSSRAREQFYSGGAGLSDPAAFIDGISAGSGQSSEPAWEQYTTIGLTQDPLPRISTTIGYGPNGIDTISFTVTGSVSKQVEYYVAIKESQLVYVNTERYGTPPGNVWNDVFRAMLPISANGGGSSAFSLNGTHNFAEIYDPSNYPYTGVPQNMAAVIFVQDVNPTTGHSYQVEAIDTVPLAANSGVSESVPTTSHLLISSNPLISEGHIGFELPQSANVQLTVSDLLGHDISTLAKGMMPSGTTSVEMSSNLFAPGCYFVRLIVDGHVMDVRKFIVAE